MNLQIKKGKITCVLHVICSCIKQTFVVLNLSKKNKNLE